MKVYVVTNVDDGWDCVRGVFSEKSDAEEFIDSFYDLDMSAEEWSDAISSYRIHEQQVR